MQSRMRSTVNNPRLLQRPDAPIGSCRERQDDELVIPVERLVSVCWLHSCGKKVAPVTGTKMSACRANEQQGENGSIHSCTSRLGHLKEQMPDGWHQKTMRLYDALAPKLEQFLRRLSLGKDEIDDVIQESFLRLAIHLRKGLDEKNLRSWLYMVARNLAMDVHRENRLRHEEIETTLRTEDEPVDPDANPEWNFLQREQSLRLKDAMSQLTAQQYNSVLLRTQGLRYGEIGKLLGTSEQRAIYLVKRGLQRLMGGM